MFLNLHAGRTNKRLTLDYKPQREKTYLSSLNKMNKEKSYSTTSLKQQFQQFKNKSMSHASLYHQPQSQYLRPQTYSPMNLNSRERIQQHQIARPVESRRANEFKKSYLQLDSKLNKCTLPKDYFRSAPLQLAQHHSPALNSYFQAQKQLQKQNTRRSMALLQEISQLRQQNSLLKLQNQELRKQRNVDLNLITRQNQIMQKQEELLVESQEVKYYQKLNQRETNQMKNDSNAYTFSNKQEFHTTQPHQCHDCLHRKRQQDVEIDFRQSKVQKLLEQKKMMKNQIHQLVYQCQKYKQALKKAEEKYQKQLQHNQKLIKLIYNDQTTKPNHKSNLHQSNYQSNNQQNLQSKLSLGQSINRQPYLNLKGKSPFYEQSQPICLKKQPKKKAEHPLYQIASPSKKSSPKMSSYKSASNLIKYIDESLSINQPTNHIFVQSRHNTYKQQKNNQWGKQDYPSKGYFSKQTQNNMDWCQNDNIKKYLAEINQQKIQEIDQIQTLLRAD